MKLNFSKIKTVPLKKRKSKVNAHEFAKVCRKGATVKEFLNSLPDILAAKSFKQLVQAVVEARKKRKPVIFGLGAHVIKCGLGPVLIDLMREGWISALAMNGATAIHDFELALMGQTSEDVDAALEDGSFGMAEETGALLNKALIEGVEQGLGAGEKLSSYLSSDKIFKYKNLSVLGECGRLKIPATIHIAIGTDIIHQHPACQGYALGESSLRDFRRLCEIVADLGRGGVFINWGSNVILPEVFLKALSVARNLKGDVTHFTTATFDMIRHYRPSENVVRRPVLTGGRGFYILGHHEILLPLFACAIRESKL